MHFLSYRRTDPSVLGIARTHGLNVHVHAQAGTDVMKSFKMQLILWEVLCSLVSNFQTFKSHCEKIPVEGFLQSYIKNDFSERPSSILFIEKCSRFNIWHSSDLDSAGANCPRTVQKITLYCKTRSTSKFQFLAWTTST